jgi:hypothetical protein
MALGESQWNAALANTHQPKNDIEKRHKVIWFGDLRPANGDAERILYEFVHERADLKVSRGAIPVGFLSTLRLDEGHPVFIETRSGGYGERGDPIGPEFQVSWKAQREVIRAGSEDGWLANLDELWSGVLSTFERKGQLSEETLDYLDADPFVLFGIDDPITQQALQKLQRVPALMCKSTAPEFDEWAYYLRVDPYDSRLKWLVKAFAETDLPKPWTCYKGVGSIVCYIHTDTGQVTWKHPFYDYFRQLRDFCRQATPAEVQQVRCNRLLWSYEATRIETEADQQPLVSPEYVSRLADIFGHDIHNSGFLVRNLKAQLKAFAKSYRSLQDISMKEVETCGSILERDCEKYYEMTEHWRFKVNTEVKFDLGALSNGELKCVESGQIATIFCLECQDYFSEGSYECLHQKGSRKLHNAFRLVTCQCCNIMPSMLQCTFTDKSLCYQCYAMKHIKMLPPDGRENPPRKIDYNSQYERFAQMARERGGESFESPGILAEDDSYEAVLSTDWHPFYDARGVKYFHNFNTGERMRQSPNQVPNEAEPGAEGQGALEQAESALRMQNSEDSADTTWMNTSTATPSDPGAKGKGFYHGPMLNIDETRLAGMGKQEPLSLTGYDRLETAVPARTEAAANPAHRDLRPPFRNHMPDYVPPE